MGRFTRTLGPLVTITGALGLWLVVMVTVSASAAPRQNGVPAARPADTTPAKAATATPAPGYVGEETCLTCHEDMKKGYHGSPHSRAKNPRTPAGAQGCESCHGPGQAHVEGGGDKTKIKNPRALSPRDASEICLSCHNRTEHANFAGGKHDSRNVSCVTCHGVHDFKSEKAQLRTETVEETCVQCHRTQVNKVHRSSHMPVGSLNGNKMECTSCHNPHGTQNVKMLKEGNSISEACTSCHAEKRGPFLWDHAVTRENCVTCHDAHGSNNERMLVAKQPMLCQRCHVSSRHPATVYDQNQVNTRSNRVMGRSCTQCHTQIHGSNHPSGNFFLR
jgi:DmsE family decaheme c-type cytochrome